MQSPEQSPSGPTPSCCAPSGALSVGLSLSAAEPVVAEPVIPGGGAHTRGQVRIPGGTFTMGDGFGEGYPADGETPAHPVTLAPYLLDATAVTNAQFATFVKATGYVTEAEEIGLSAVFHLAVRASDADVVGSATGTPWWLVVRGADWRHPAGPLSDAGELANHPVVHVTLARRPGLLPLGRQAAADRGRVGVRRPRRARGCALRLGRRADPARALAVQHLAGRLPAHQHRRGRPPHHCTGALVRAERARPLQHRRQRLGVVPGPLLPHDVRRSPPPALRSSTRWLRAATTPACARADRWRG